MLRLHGVLAPGVVAAIRRRVGLHLEILVLCDAARGDSAPTASRGFYRLVGVGESRRPAALSPAALSPAITLYEPISNCGILRRYTVKSFLACAAFCEGSGLTFYSEGHEIFTLNAQNIVRRVICEAKFYYPSAITVPDPETLWVTDAQGLHLLRLSPEPDGSSVAATFVCSRSHDEDWRGHVGITCTSGQQVMYSATTIYKVADASGGWKVWAGNENHGGSADGPGPLARFSSITAVGLDGNGAAVVLDAQQDGRTAVRHVDQDGYVETIFCPTHSDGDEVLGEADFRGELLSCDSGASASPICASAYRCCNSSPADSFENVFLGGGLRCPLVLDGRLALCAPLQDCLVLLQVPGLRESSCRSVGLVSPARACSSASDCSLACDTPVMHCSIKSPCRLQLHSSDCDAQSSATTLSCDSCSSGSSGSKSCRFGNRMGVVSKCGVGYGGKVVQSTARCRKGCGLHNATHCCAVQPSDDESEVTSHVSYTGLGDSVGMRADGKRPLGSALDRQYRKKQFSARKRFRR